MGAIKVHMHEHILRGGVSGILHGKIEQPAGDFSGLEVDASSDLQLIWECHEWSLYDYQRFVGNIRSVLSSTSGFSSLPRLPSVYAKDAESDQDSRLFPPWRAFLAPIGGIVLLWGWKCIRSETNLLRGGIAFGVGAIFWMYGLVIILNLVFNLSQRGK